MANMYKVMAWFTGIFAVFFYLGGMNEVSLLFVGNTGLFLLLGFLNLSERMYMYIFGAYLTVFLCWIYVLYNIHSHARWRTLIANQNTDCNFAIGVLFTLL